VVKVVKRRQLIEFVSSLFQGTFDWFTRQFAESVQAVNAGGLALDKNGARSVPLH
jgi:hypothetical protein